MIKILYMASIPLFILLILIFVTLNLTYRFPMIDHEMTRTSEMLIKNSPAPDSSEIAANQSTLPMPSEIWKNNIFDSSRALSADNSGDNLSLKDVTLVGVFGYGPVAGGIFLINNPSTASGGGYSYGTSGQQGKDAPLKPKMIFLIGDRLPNGYVLKSVENNAVILQSGDHTVPVEIQFADDASVKRLAEAQRSNVQQQVKIIETGKEGSLGSSTSGSTSSSVIIRNTPDQKQNN